MRQRITSFRANNVQRDLNVNFQSHSSIISPSWVFLSLGSMTVLVKRFSSNALSEHWNELVSRGRIESIFNRLSKWVVSALFASIILLRHDGTALWAIIGSVSNSALSVFLKRLLNQARPATTSRTDPGMPSSHAQSISFISVFAVLSVMEWLGTNEVSLFLIMLILALGSYFIRLRFLRNSTQAIKW
uniref:Phosphatidic acid phosphatase type 2/haloperoxidase domain-containing protein n=2 Tax=Brassica oleracea var. oleracea TaxID=109376 RepID=A0A0D3DS30_BRAOL